MNQMWITVATFMWHVDALLAKSRLDSAGIDSRLADEHLARIVPVAVVVGGIKLQVSPEDQDAAQQVLNGPSIVK